MSVTPSMPVLPVDDSLTPEQRRSVAVNSVVNFGLMGPGFLVLNAWAHNKEMPGITGFMPSNGKSNGDAMRAAQVNNAQKQGGAVQVPKSVQEAGEAWEHAYKEVIAAGSSASDTLQQHAEKLNLANAPAPVREAMHQAAQHAEREASLQNVAQKGEAALQRASANAHEHAQHLQSKLEGLSERIRKTNLQVVQGGVGLVPSTQTTQAEEVLSKRESLKNIGVVQADGSIVASKHAAKVERAVDNLVKHDTENFLVAERAVLSGRMEAKQNVSAMKQAVQAGESAIPKMVDHAAHVVMDGEHIIKQLGSKYEKQLNKVETFLGKTAESPVTEGLFAATKRFSKEHPYLAVASIAIGGVVSLGGALEARERYRHENRLNNMNNNLMQTIAQVQALQAPSTQPLTHVQRLAQQPAGVAPLART